MPGMVFLHTPDMIKPIAIALIMRLITALPQNAVTIDSIASFESSSPCMAASDFHSVETTKMTTGGHTHESCHQTTLNVSILSDSYEPTNASTIGLHVSMPTAWTSPADSNNIQVDEQQRWPAATPILRFLPDYHSVVGTATTNTATPIVTRIIAEITQIDTRQLRPEAASPNLCEERCDKTYRTCVAALCGHEDAKCIHIAKCRESTCWSEGAQFVSALAASKISESTIMSDVSEQCGSTCGYKTDSCGNIPGFEGGGDVIDDTQQLTNEASSVIRS